MNKSRLTYCLMWSCLFLAVGCEPKLSTSEHPAIMQKVFSASPDRVWEYSLEVIRRQNGIVLTKDKSLGLIVCKIPDRSIAGPKSRVGEGIWKSVDTKKYPEPYIYLNVYIKQPSPEPANAIVYAIPYDALRDVCYARVVPERISAFQDVTFRKNYQSKVSTMFFEGLRANFKEAEL